ncbi:MAG: DUF4190 domain-containing protein [Phycisphaeraceae bacterium]
MPHGNAGPQTSGLAVASLILGLLSYVCFGFFASIPAVICGHLARGRIKRQPDQHAGAGLALVGLILGYLNIVLCIVAIAVAIVRLPAALDQARTAAYQTQSMSQLRQLGVAALIYASDHDDVLPHTWDQFDNYIYPGFSTQQGQVPDLLLVPNATDTSQPSYEFVITEPTVTTDIQNPSQTIYIQEREPFWNGRRNVLYADGSVRTVDEATNP